MALLFFLCRVVAKYLSTSASLCCHLYVLRSVGYSRKVTATRQVLCFGEHQALADPVPFRRSACCLASELAASASPRTLIGYGATGPVVCVEERVVVAFGVAFFPDLARAPNPGDRWTQNWSTHKR